MQCIFPLPLVICLCTYSVCTTWLPGDADLCLPNRTLPQPPSASHPRRASPQLLVPQPHGSCPSSKMWWDPHGASSSKHPQLLRSDHGWVLQENGGGGSKQLEQVPSSMEIPRNLANTWAKGFLKKTLTTQKPKMSIFFFLNTYDKKKAGFRKPSPTNLQKTVFEVCSITGLKDLFWEGECLHFWMNKPSKKSSKNFTLLQYFHHIYFLKWKNY